MLGIFDSGVGGLTVARAIRTLAPRADLFYLGDTAHAPYGNRSADELERLTLAILRRLRAERCDVIVSACNSVSAAVLRPMFDLFDSGGGRIVEMVGPSADGLRAQGVRDVAVLATAATCRTGMYAQACAELGMRAAEIAVPALAGAVEAGDERAIGAAAEEAVARVPAGVSNVLFGCTHFPLVRERFVRAARAQRRDLVFIDPAPFVAQEAIRRAGTLGRGRTRVACTKPTPTFARLAHELLGVTEDEIEVMRLE